LAQQANHDFDLEPVLQLAVDDGEATLAGGDGKTVLLYSRLDDVNELLIDTADGVVLRSDLTDMLLWRLA